MASSVTQQSPQPKFNRAAIKDKYLTVMVNGKPVAMAVNKMSDDTLRKALRISSNKTALAAGWTIDGKGQVVKASPVASLPTSHEDPRRPLPPVPTSPVPPPPVPGGIVNTKPNPAVGTPAPITEEIPTSNPIYNGTVETDPKGSSLTTAGGNRSTKHVVGGAGSNFGYAEGNMLGRARGMYGANVAGGPNSMGHYGFFSGTTSVRPGHATQNQMHQNSLGNVLNRGAQNSYHRAAGGQVDQATVHPNQGHGYGEQWQDIPKKTSGRPIVPVTGGHPASSKPNLIPGGHGVAPGTVKPANPTPTKPAPTTWKPPAQNQLDQATGGQANSTQSHSQMRQNWKVGEVYQGRLIMGGQWIVRPGGRRVYVPIVHNPGGASKTMIHPAWAGMRN